MLDKHIKAFVIYMLFLLTMAIHPTKKDQIVFLIAKKVQILLKYPDFSDIFLEEKVLVSLVTTKLNSYAIKL